MSEEVAAADATLTALHQAQAEVARLMAENDRLLALLETAEQDSAGLLIILRELDYSDPEQAQRLLDQVREGAHPGRELMAHLTRKFGAAQSLADAVRAYAQRETACLPIEKADTLALGRVLGALRDYDETVKAREQ